MLKINVSPDAPTAAKQMSLWPPGAVLIHANRKGDVYLRIGASSVVNLSHPDRGVGSTTGYIDYYIDVDATLEVNG